MRVIEGQRVQIKKLLRNIDAYVLRADRTTALCRTSKGQTVRVPLDSLLPQFRPIVTAAKVIVYTGTWEDFIRSPTVIGKYDTFLMEAIWYRVNTVLFKRKLPRPMFAIKVIHEAAKLDLVKDRVRITISTLPFKMRGLLVAIGHETIHQFQWESDLHSGALGGWHGKVFDRYCQRMGAAFGVKVTIELDEKDSDMLDFDLTQNLQNKNLFYVFAWGAKTGAGVWGAYSDSEEEAVALFDVLVKDDELHVAAYKSRDGALVASIPKMKKNEKGQHVTGLLPRKCLYYAQKTSTLIETSDDKTP